MTFINNIVWHGLQNLSIPENSYHIVQINLSFSEQSVYLGTNFNGTQSSLTRWSFFFILRYYGTPSCQSPGYFL